MLTVAIELDLRHSANRVRIDPWGVVDCAESLGVETAIEGIASTYRKVR